MAPDVKKTMRAFSVTGAAVNTMVVSFSPVIAERPGAWTRSRVIAATMAGSLCPSRASSSTDRPSTPPCPFNSLTASSAPASDGAPIEASAPVTL